MTKDNLTEKVSNSIGFNEKKKNFILKAVTVPGFLPYSLYQDIKEDQKDKFNFSKLVDRLNLEDMLLMVEVEFFKAFTYGVAAYSLYKYLH